MATSKDVLIVDDAIAIRKILQRVLQQTDIEIGTVYEAADGAQALQLLKEKPVDLIFSDINMPNMDGIQFLQAVHAHETWKNIPVLMITTEGSQEKVMEAVTLGARGYVRKPFTHDQIRDTLSELF